MRVSSSITSSVFFSAVLTQHHLKYLLEDTFDSQTKWRFIGLYLGLPPPTLDAIGKKFDSSDEQYAEVLQKWLQSGVTPTMRKLIEALESNTVKENNIATQLRSKYTMKTTPLLKGTYNYSGITFTFFLCYSILLLGIPERH